MKHKRNGSADAAPPTDAPHRPETAEPSGGQTGHQAPDRTHDYLNVVETMIVALDREGRITTINRKGCALLGWTEHELIGQFWFSFCLPQPEGAEKIFPMFRKHMAGEMEATEYFENPILTRSGALRQIAWHNALLRDDHGRITGVLSSGDDITERKRIETALHASRQLVEGILDAIPMRVFWKDRNLVFLGCNAAFARDAGLADPKDVIGKDDYQMVWRDQAESYRRDDRRVIESGRAEVLIEEPQTTPDGKTITLLTSKVPLRGSEGEVYGVLGTYADITERKRTEEALRESEERFRSLIENASDGITILDRDGRNRYLSPAAQKLTGYSADEMAGRSAFDFVHPDDLARAEAMWDQVLDDPEHVVTEEIRFRHKDGTWRTFECTDSNLLGDPAVQGVVINTRDVTERTELEAQLRHSQRMEAVGRLAGGVAHDFNNMLGVILGHADLALEQVNPDHPLRADLEDIRKAAVRSADLTRQLLAFARKQTVAPEVLDLNDTVAGVLTMLHRLIGENIRIKWQPEADLWPVKVDPTQIDQILANLCVNARDAITGVGTLTIETGNVTFDERSGTRNEAAAPGDYVLLAVSDTGCGMDKDVLSHLFEPYFTTKVPGTGTGLGLATVYGIVRQNQGFVNVYSEPSLGTTTKVYLPRHVGDAAQARPTVAAAPMPRGHETILLVEDEPSILTLAKTMLERQGYTVVAAGTPGEAMNLADEHAGEIHLLLSDVVMPEMNGRMLAGNLLSRRPRLKRLFMSGYTADVIAYQGVLDEGVHFIQKPFSAADLAAKVREALDAEP